MATAGSAGCVPAAHPLCVMCDARGITAAASVVDHIQPHKGDPVLFWDQANWQSLCKGCHDSRKQMIEAPGKVPPHASWTEGGEVKESPADPLERARISTAISLTDKGNVWAPEAKRAPQDSPLTSSRPCANGWRSRRN